MQTFLMQEIKIQAQEEQVQGMPEHVEAPLIFY